MKKDITCKRSGFTLIELIVVVLIITILATIVGVKVIPELSRAKVAKATAQISNFRTALNLYRMDTGRLPTRQQGLESLCVKPSLPPVPVKYRDAGYLESLTVPLDSWGNEYVYLVPGTSDEPYEIISYGADGEPGGENEDADISSSRLE
ncbi:MAG: type II secretion system major pseudopilin GspG [Kiritimatiellae bacterium]|nr:type II secretion system major pseudopilin GspG [Kiritimatiellia bacterium]